MALVFQGMISTIRQSFCQGVRRVPHHLRTFLAVYDERGDSDGANQSSGQRAENHRVIGQSVCHFFQRWPERRIP